MDLGALHHIAVRQQGIVTRADLDELGLSPWQRRTLLGRRSLEPIGRRTFRVGGAPVTPSSTLLAACLDTGGVATEVSAAGMHRLGGLRAPARPVVLVLRPGGDHRSPLAVVRTTNWLPSHDVLEVDGIPCTSVARTLFSLAGVESIAGADLRDLVDEAVRDRKATDAWLWWVLEHLRCRGRGGVAVLERILTERAGGAVTESWLERELLAVLDRAGVPRPRCQARVSHKGAFVGRVDFIYPELGIVIEVSGHRTHSTRSQRAADARRRNDLQATGLHVLEFTFEDVVTDPDYVVRAIVDARARVAGRAA